MSSGSTSRPAGVRSTEREHLFLVREMLERPGVDDAARHCVRVDPARRELDAEVAHDRLERGLRRPDEHVVVEHALRAEARDCDERRALSASSARSRERARAAHARSRSSSSPNACPRSRAPGGSRRSPRCARRRVYGPCDASSSTTRAFDTSPRTSTGSPPAARTSLGRLLRGVVVAHVAEHDALRAVTHESQRDREPDPPCAAGDEHRRAVEAHRAAGEARPPARSSAARPSRAGSAARGRRRAPSRRRSRAGRAAPSSPRRSGAPGAPAGRSRTSSSHAGAELVGEVRRRGPDEGVDVGEGRLGHRGKA